MERNDYREVTYEEFEKYFWPQVRHLDQAHQLTPETTWTQIISVIKGSMSSYIHPNYAEPRKLYLERTQGSLLSIHKR